MMSLTHADIADFSHFASQQIGNGGSEFTLAQLAIRWQAAKERNEAVAAIREGLADIDAGRTQDAFEFVAEMRSKYNIPMLSACLEYNLTQRLEKCWH
jgi:predicted transcriptional regulator